MEITASPAKASAGMLTIDRPFEARSAVASRVLLHARTSWPAFRRLIAIPRPMCPRPMNPTFMEVLRLLLAGSTLFGHQLLDALRLVAKPGGIRCGRIKDGSCFERLKLSMRGGARRLCQQCTASPFIHRTKRTCSFECLLETFQTVDAGDHHRCGKAEGVVKTLDGGDGAGLQDHTVGQTFHPQHTGVPLHELG